MLTSILLSNLLVSYLTMLYTFVNIPPTHILLTPQTKNPGTRIHSLFRTNEPFHHIFFLCFFQSIYRAYFQTIFFKKSSLSQIIEYIFNTLYFSWCRIKNINFFCFQIILSLFILHIYIIDSFSFTYFDTQYPKNSSVSSSTNPSITRTGPFLGISLSKPNFERRLITAIFSASVVA